MRFFQIIKDFRVILSIIFVTVFIGSNLTGQNRNMVFSHFDKTQGISDIFFNGMVQDRQGFLWIATWDGLNRYDGNSFKVYKKIEGDSTSLSSSGVRSLTIDNKGRMWVLCVNGINVYDSQKDNFIRFYVNDVKNEQFIVSILPDSKGTLWVGTQSNGLWEVPVDTLTVNSKTKLHFKEYRLENNDPNSLSRNNVASIFEDKQSNIWISNGTTIVDLYNPVHDNFEHFTINVPGLDNTTNYTITFLLEDNEGILWLGSNGAGLISWDRKHNTFKLYKHQLGKNSISSDMVRHIRQDKEGILWISTDGGGISFYDKKSGLFEYCKRDPYNPNSLSGDGIAASLEDKSGVVWIGASRLGLNKFEANKTKFGLHIKNPWDKNGLSVDDVNSFLEDKEGNIWIGGGGLNFFEKKINKYKHFLNDPNNPNSLSSNAVLCMTADNEGNIWIGTYAGGLNCYNRKKNKFTSYKHNTADIYSISHNNIFVVWADSKNNIWAGTMEGTLNLFDRKTGRFYQYKKIPGNPDSFNENYMSCIFEDSRHYLWIGTSIGLNMVKLNDYDFTKPFPNLKFYHYIREENANSIGASNFSAINEDHESNMWFGTDGSGVAKMDMKTYKFKDYGIKDGLTSNNIRAILEDNDNNLWISTTNGISKFDPITGTSRNFNVYDGLQDSRFSRAHLKTKDGKLYFGGGKGYNAFYPRDITFNKIPPNVVIADLKVFNKSVAVGEKIQGDIILDQAINGTKELVLSYKINFFSFEFVTLDFTSPEKNNYAYKMEGFDNQWNNTDAKNRIATYTNLNPGKYTFRVKASNNDGVWNEKGVSLNIFITPPFWQTSWFYGFMLVVVVGIVFGLYRWRVWQLLENEKELKKRVDESLAKIKILSGLIPICASCKKIRNDKGYWNQLEEYINEHSEATFSHGVCPECAEKLYGGYLAKMKKQQEGTSSQSLPTDSPKE